MRRQTVAFVQVSGKEYLESEHFVSDSRYTSLAVLSLN